jgi:hypothetical protein
MPSESTNRMQAASELADALETGLRAIVGTADGAADVAARLTDGAWRTTAEMTKRYDYLPTPEERALVIKILREREDPFTGLTDSDSFGRDALDAQRARNRRAS